MQTYVTNVKNIASATDTLLSTLRIRVAATTRLLLVVDLLALAVQQKQDGGAQEEDGGAPSHAVRPPEVPRRLAALVDLLHEHGWEDDDSDHDAGD